MHPEVCLLPPPSWLFFCSSEHARELLDRTLDSARTVPIFRLLGNCLEICFNGSWDKVACPYGSQGHRIHLGRMDYPKTPPQNHSSTKQLFPGPFFGAKKVPWPKCRAWGSKIRSWVPKSTPGHEKTKDARRKTMQNPALEKSNGAI